MGIQGLLPLLKDAHEPCHLRDFSGQTIGVDAYVWLHRGAFSCAQDLCLNKGTTRYLNFCAKRLAMLRDNGIKPFVVLDGGPLPMKAGTEASRRAKRQEKRRQGLELLKAGSHAAAMDCFQQCLDVTPLMAFKFIKMLREQGVPFVVAPYEADAQLAYLERTGLIDGVLTEDSDLLAFGCQKVLFKLDNVGGVTMIQQKNLTRARGLNLAHMTMSQFRHLCILSGCDYLGSIPNMGLKTAHKYIKRWKTPERAIRQARFDGLRVPPDYLENFYKADRAFMYQRVYNPLTKALDTLTPLPQLGPTAEPHPPEPTPPSSVPSNGVCSQVPTISAAQLAWIGKELDPDVAHGVATGLLNPFTFEPNHLVDGPDPDGLHPEEVAAFLAGTGPLPAPQRTSLLEDPSLSSTPAQPPAIRRHSTSDLQSHWNRQVVMTQPPAQSTIPNVGLGAVPGSSQRHGQSQNSRLPALVVSSHMGGLASAPKKVFNFTRSIKRTSFPTATCTTGVQSAFFSSGVSSSRPPAGQPPALPVPKPILCPESPARPAPAPAKDHHESERSTPKRAGLVRSFSTSFLANLSYGKPASPSDLVCAASPPRQPAPDMSRITPNLNDSEDGVEFYAIYEDAVEALEDGDENGDGAVCPDTDQENALPADTGPPLLKSQLRRHNSRVMSPTALPLENSPPTSPSADTPTSAKASGVLYNLKERFGYHVGLKKLQRHVLTELNAGPRTTPGPDLQNASEQRGATTMSFLKGISKTFAHGIPSYGPGSRSKEKESDFQAPLSSQDTSASLVPLRRKPLGLSRGFPSKKAKQS